jgi:hypothetical protein
VLKNNSLYEFYEDRVNWTTAKAICEQKGGHLITIDSKYENDIAISLISEEYASWIGYTDVAKEGEWKDTFDNKATYSNWTEGEPNNHWNVENYAEVYKTGLWNDTKNFGSSFAKIGFICEYDNAISSIKPDKTVNELGHTYEIYTTKMSWKDAYRFCEKKGGHLVTVDSQDEEEIVYEIQKMYSPYDKMWLGATDEYSEGTWKWITGESINYKNWADGEPNDDNDEDYMMMYKSNGKWNDVADSAKSGLYTYSFICEYDSQLEMPKFTVAKTFEYNDNKYEVYSNIVDWQTANNLCNQKGGHLVTIGSLEENNAIIRNIQGLSNERYWIGLTDVKAEGMWNWINGESGTYSNWNNGEPNNDGGMEDYGEIIASSGKWNDMAGYFCTHRNIGFICEYENQEELLLPTEPATVKPTEGKTEPTETTTEPVTDKSTEPTTDKPTESTETEPVETQPTESTPTDPTEPSSSETPTETQSATDTSTKPTTDKPTEPATAKPTDSKTDPTETTPNKPTEPIVTEPQPTAPEPTVPVVEPTEKKDNPIKVTAKTKTVKLKKLKKKTQTIKPLTISKAQGTVTVTLVKSGTTKKIRAKVTVSKKGVITLKKSKYTKGTYKVKVKIVAKGNSKYKSKKINKTVTIKIK